ncbi:hypothetical protein BRADI_3g32086v3 [Brachypodium distachyon]|uniref:Uncharacterized protein n=1 Tax=Brachypodium distachyon TaxID=15368 RepID=A0A2K2D0H0_BRADI|nr:hypothetical protein BRADI_3g32086v3 [Brachypodium distachyon]PNT67779.1 hypothetical protein BRADI_3g32086v3 [Brachypodium distachyon]PNT67780.1 hypothetical protein BRADI_3g32086v3 [Brachypodium distachyon]PNT67781.1 hypothetical protein BRADI_3g32086v3 [Brachypodium distachyon]
MRAARLAAPRRPAPVAALCLHARLPRAPPSRAASPPAAAPRSFAADDRNHLAGRPPPKLRPRPAPPYPAAPSRAAPCSPRGAAAVLAAQLAQAQPSLLLGPSFLARLQAQQAQARVLFSFVLFLFLKLMPDVWALLVSASLCSLLCCCVAAAPCRAALLLHFVDAREDHIALEMKRRDYIAYVND